MKERLQYIANFIRRQAVQSGDAGISLEVLESCITEYDQLRLAVENHIEEKDTLIATLKQAIEDTHRKMAELDDINQRLLKQKSQVEKQNKELAESVKIATNATSVKSNFLSTMSHEIRSPLNAIIGMSYILLEDEPKPHQIKNLNILRFSAENLLSLVNDILDLNKIEAGKLELENREFDLKQFIQQLIAMFNVNASQKNIKLRSILDSDLPQIVRGDITRLNQVLTNLLSNAIKFTDEGSVTLEVSLLEQVNNSSRIEFRVADTGLGIEPEKQSTIFETFRQADHDTYSRYGGTGLGLSIIKSLLHLMNSDVHLSSKPGVGSEFLFVLELDTPRNHVMLNNRIYQKHPKDFNRMDGCKILLVEDNEFNIVVARTYLENWGTSVDIAKDGQQGVEKAKNKAYDVILLDLQMPKMDGMEAARSIRSSGLNVATPIIALTATVTTTVRAEVIEAGMTDYLPKPFNPADLHKKVASHLNLLKKVA